jgi:sugar/nucleoside kinase (ribokinase family)
MNPSFTTPEKSFDVLVVGELNVDLILNDIRKYPEIGKEVLASQMDLTLGSSSAIFASNLSTLGTRVAFAGMLGQDNFGDHVIDSLKSRGVDTQYIIRSPKQSTGATIILNFGEDRAMVTYPGAMNHFQVADIAETAIESAKHLHLSSVFLLPALMPDITSLFKKAKALGLTTSIDPQWDPAEKWDVDLSLLLPYVDVFMPNVTELYALTQAGTVQQGIDRLKDAGKVVVVKNGSQGAYLWDGDTLSHQPPFLNRTVVDSIGAGDSFDAGFIHKYLRREPLRQCLEFGALAGAINTTRPGGTNAFESFSLVKTIAQSTFNYELL